MAGTNDLGTLAPARDIAGNLATLHARCLEMGSSTTAISIVEGSFSAAGGPLCHKREEVNRLLKNWAEGNSAALGMRPHPGTATYVDMASEIPFMQGSPYWEPDGLH